jgi:WD40 repeat protein
VNARRLWFALALLLLGPGLVGLSADKDPYGDPLPEGAKARLGTARLRMETYSPTLLTPDGKSLYALTNFGMPRLDPFTGAVQAKFQRAFGGSIGGVSADGNRVVQIGFGGVTVWDIGGAKSLAKVQRRLPSSNYPVALSTDGKTLVLGGANEPGKADPVTVLVWDVDGDKEVQKITVPQNQSASAAVSGNGKTVATWGTHTEPGAKGAPDPGVKGAPDPETNLNRFVHFWDAGTGKALGKFRSYGYAPGTVVLNGAGSLAAVSNNNGTIDLVDTKTGTSKFLLLGRSRMGQWIAFSPDGATVAGTGDDGAVQRWKVADGTRLSTTEAPVPNVSGARVRLLDNEKGLAWTMKGAAVLVWEVPSGKLRSPEGGHTNPVRAVTVSPDNKYVVTSADDGVALKWELATGKPAGSVALHHPGGVGGYTPAPLFSADLARALVRDTSGSLGVHDVATGIQQFVLPVPFEGYSVGTFSTDGSKVIVATSSFDTRRAPSRVTVWDVVAGKRLLALDLPGFGSVAAALTPDAKHVVVVGRKPAEKGNGDFVAAAYAVATGARKGEYTEEAGFTNPLVATAADNKSAAVVTAKGRVVSFNLETGKVDRTFDLNRRVPAIAPVFSPDGKKLALAIQAEFDEDRTAPVLVLDWASGEIRHPFRTRAGSPGAMAFSPDGKWLVTGSNDTTATVWDVSK